MSIIPEEITFELKGRNISRFISRCNADGIVLHKVYRNAGSSAVTVTVAARDAKQLLKTAGDCRLRVHTKHRRGFMRLVKLANRRFVLLYGITLAIVLLFVMSHFVWVIEIEGLYNIPTEHINTLLENVGLRRFIYIDREKINNLAEELAVSDMNIAKATVHISGVKMTVTVNETIAEDTEHKISDNTNIYAEKDGVIEQVTVRSGVAVVKKGDVVQKGDLIISGEISNDEKTVYVPADGSVKARVGYSFSASAGQFLPAKVRSKECYSINKITLFGFDFLKSQFEEYEYEQSGEVAECSILFPIRITPVTLYEITDGYKSATLSERRAYAEQKAYTLLVSSIDKNAVILSKNTTCEEDESGNCTVCISVVALEEIAPCKD